MENKLGKVYQISAFPWLKGQEDNLSGVIDNYGSASCILKPPSDDHLSKQTKLHPVENFKDARHHAIRSTDCRIPGTKKPIPAARTSGTTRKETPDINGFTRPTARCHPRPSNPLHGPSRPPPGQRPYQRRVPRTPGPTLAPSQNRAPTRRPVSRPSPRHRPGRPLDPQPTDNHLPALGPRPPSNTIHPENEPPATRAPGAVPATQLSTGEARRRVGAVDCHRALAGGEPEQGGEGEEGGQAVGGCLRAYAEDDAGRGGADS